MNPVFRLLLIAIVGLSVLTGGVLVVSSEDGVSSHSQIDGGELAAGGDGDSVEGTISERAAKIALGNNANAVLSLDLIADGGAGNRRDDRVSTGAVSGRGTTIALEVFVTGVTTSLRGVILRFDFDASLVSFVKAENSAFVLSLPEGSVGAALAATSPATLASSGFLARAEFETIADVSGREFSIGIESVTLAESSTSSDVVRTSSEVSFNAAPSPDFDGDGTVGFSDFLTFAGAFGSSQGDGKYNSAQDLNSDGSVDFTDFLIFAGEFGSQAPPSGGGGTTTPPSGNPDLLVVSLSISDSSLTPGQSFTLSATVRNGGNEPAAATTLRYYRSDDATVSTRDTEVGTDAVRGLAASGTSDESINLTAPSGAGTYFYGACVDEVTGESGTGNNCSAVVTVTVSTGAPPVSGATKLYWTEWRSGKIRRSNLDGSGMEDLITNGSPGPRGIALDESGGKMYWASDSAILQRSNLDGSGVEDLTISGLLGLTGIALDVSGGKMYWTDHSSGEIKRSNLDGFGVEDLVTGLDLPLGIALDVSGGKMYWTEWRSDKIKRSNLDGSGVEDLVTTGLSAPDGIALDVSGSKMYWTDSNTDKIKRSNLDGSGVEDLVTTGLRTPRGIALDVSGGKMYWAEWSSGKIRRSNLDGSGVEDLVTTGFGLALPIGIALGLAVPVVAGPDLVVRTSVDVNTLTTGQSFTLSATVRNQGNASAVATTLRYFRSSNATISTDGTEEGTDAVSTLSAGATSAESITLNAPSDAGTYYYGACVEGVSGESNTNNNCSSGVSVTVSGGGGGSGGACRAGLVVNPGETCTYKGNTFSVSSSGRGSIAFFSAGTGIDARGTTINGVRWNFHATKNSGSNSWTIHVAD